MAAARLKLIGTFTSPYTRKARVVAAEKRIEYTWESESPWPADTAVPDWNPLGQGSGAGARRRHRALRFPGHLRVPRLGIAARAADPGRRPRADRGPAVGSARRRRARRRRALAAGERASVRASAARRGSSARRARSSAASTRSSVSSAAVRSAPGRTSRSPTSPWAAVSGGSTSAFRSSTGGPTGRTSRGSRRSSSSGRRSLKPFRTSSPAGQPPSRPTRTMEEFLGNPAVQGGVAPFVVGLIVVAILGRAKLGGLAVVAAFAVCVHLASGLTFTPLTALRKVVLLGLIAPVVGIAIDFVLEGGPNPDGRRRACVRCAHGVGVLERAAAEAGRRSAAPRRRRGRLRRLGRRLDAGPRGSAGARRRGGADARPGRRHLGDPRRVGAARACTASRSGRGPARSCSSRC